LKSSSIRRRGQSISNGRPCCSSCSSAAPARSLWTTSYGAVLAGTVVPQDLAAWRNRAAGISCNFAWKLESPGLVPGFFEQVAAHKSQLRFRSFVRFELELGQNQSKWYNMRQMRNGQVTEKTVKTQRALSRRFCVAPMMESRGSRRKALDLRRLA